MECSLLYASFGHNIPVLLSSKTATSRELRSPAATDRATPSLYTASEPVSACQSSLCLRSAVEASNGYIRFRVVYVLSQSRTSRPFEGADIVDALRHRDVSIAATPETAVAYSLGKVDIVTVGPEGVVENGGIISKLGMYQIGMLTKGAGKPLYVVPESHKLEYQDIPNRACRLHLVGRDCENLFTAVRARSPSVLPVILPSYSWIYSAILHEPVPDRTASRKSELPLHALSKRFSLCLHMRAPTSLNSQALESLSESCRKCYNRPCSSMPLLFVRYACELRLNSH